MKKIFQQDECAPDSMDVFKEKLAEFTGYTWEAFQQLATEKKLEMGYELHLDEWIVSWYCDDPFYKLVKRECYGEGLPSTTGEKWYFTFGYGHTTPGGYPLRDVVVEVEGDYGEARAKLVAVVGDKFAFQYGSFDELRRFYREENIATLENLKRAWEEGK